MAVSLEQSRKRERALEEEGRRLAEERADALRLLKELQGEEGHIPKSYQLNNFCISVIILIRRLDVLFTNVLGLTPASIISLY